jgi:Asp-tRNA(Asn)/Glu-tRNA(Gln) amidotransferase A subunit family amidase
VWLSHPAVTTRSVDDVGLVLHVLAERPVPPVVTARLRIGAASNVTMGKQVTLAFNRAIETFRSLGHAIISARVPLEIPPIGDVDTIEVDRAAIARRAFAAVDGPLLPTTSTTVLPVARARGNPMAVPAVHTVFANYLGLPAVSVPCGFHRNGLPLALQIVGRPWDDGVVLGLARQYETATAWKAKHAIE